MAFFPTRPNEPLLRTTFLDPFQTGAGDKHPGRSKRTGESSRLPYLRGRACKKPRLHSSSASVNHRTSQFLRPGDRQEESKRKKNQRPPYPDHLPTPLLQHAMGVKKKTARKRRLPA